jgi:cytidylate kinase
VLWQLDVFEDVADRDLVIDTTVMTPDDVVDVILAAVTRRLPFHDR